MENKSDVVLCVVGLFYKHKDKSFCNQTKKCLPPCPVLFWAKGKGQPLEGSVPSSRPGCRQQKTQRRGLVTTSGVALHMGVSQHFSSKSFGLRYWSQSEFIDGKLEGKSFVSSFAF